MQGIKQYYPLCASEIKIYRHDRKKVYADTFAVLKSQMDMHCLKKEERKQETFPAVHDFYHYSVGKCHQNTSIEASIQTEAFPASHKNTH